MGVLWTLFVAAAVVAAAVNGRMAELSRAAVESAGSAVTLALGLTGVMALWLGLMRVAEEAGLVRVLARAARPVMTRLFPDVPPDHPAVGAMLMNVSANVLGLGNAATPFGVKAMQELETLNPHPGAASNAQALFCALNTASVQLIPVSVIALRAAAGSRAPAEIIGATVLASLCGATAAVVAAKLLQRVVPPPGGPGRDAASPPSPRSHSSTVLPLSLDPSPPLRGGEGMGKGSGGEGTGKGSAGEGTGKGSGGRTGREGEER